ncbi:hypothetical protein H4Q26_008956 [Puccinia striiformis f. sp. tritici PST-130]|nr:hypothetical protein H4Q26_008956 [Puccinia striiformis f. sp. tritici PST-130]
MDRAASTTQYKPYTIKTSQTHLCKFNSVFKFNKGKLFEIIYPELNQGPKTNRNSTIDLTGVLGKAPSLNSTNPLVAGLDKQRELPPKYPSFASSSSNSTMKISTKESQGRQQGPKEWRISVQNSSSGFSASQRLEKAVNTTQSRILDSKMMRTKTRMDSRLGKSTRYSAQDGAESSPEPKPRILTGDSSSSVPTQDKQQPPEKSQSSSWIAPPILPSSSAGPQPGLQVSTGGKITVISVGLGFSSVCSSSRGGRIDETKDLEKHQSSVIHISRPQSQSVEDDNSSFSSPRQSSLEDGMHDFNARFEPGYQPSDHEQEIGVDPFGVSYHVNHDRYESHASSFVTLQIRDSLPTRSIIDLTNSPQSPHEPQGSAPRRSDDTSLIPITFPHFEEQQRRGPLGHEDQDYGRPEVLPHSATPWHPHQEQCNDDSATEVATRFSDGETMFDDGRDAPPFIRIGFPLFLLWICVAPNEYHLLLLRAHWH